MGSMDIQLSERNGIKIVSVRGELDLYSSFKLKEQMIRLAANPPSGIILDLEKTTYIDSSGVGVLILTNSLCRSKKIGFKTVQVHGPVRRVIELTKLLGYLPIAKDADEAILALSSDVIRRM